MSFFSLKSKISVGVDIGTTTIKIVELEKTDQGITLANYGILESLGRGNQLNHVLQTSNSNLLDTELIEYLQILKKKIKLRTNKVHLSLPAFMAFTTLLELPKMGEGGTASEVAAHAEKHIPLPITAVSLDWIKVGERKYEDGKKTQQIFLVSIPNEKLANYSEIFNKAGFEIESFEIENIAAARALTKNSEKNNLIIDIGGRSTAITVARGGVTMFSGQTDFASGSLTHALSKALTISPLRAEKMKRTAPIVDNPGGHELSTALLPIIDVIIKESARIKEGFEKNYNQKIEMVSLTGGGSQMPGLAEYINKQFGLPVIKNNGLQALIYPEKLKTINPSLGANLTVATGLALKGME